MRQRREMLQENPRNKDQLRQVNKDISKDVQKDLRETITTNG